MAASITSGYGLYVGASNDIRSSFDLTYKGNKIFQRFFDSTDTSVVGVGSTLSTIKLNNHFFVSGEQIVYSFPEDSEPIGIATTSITGIGLTDKLPNNVYVVKVNDSFIRLTDSAENALKFRPKYFNITSVGVGTLHSFTAKKQNSKSLLSIDNVIQSPITSTGSTTYLVNSISNYNSIITLSDITSFSSGDLIKIDNEIIKIYTVGVGATNDIMVKRSAVGSSASFHSAGSLVTKIYGNYNIVDNTVYFDGNLYGQVPEETENPNDLDYQGITTSSSFSGRIFLRTAPTEESSDAYDTNFVFDSIAHEFIGIGTSYDLTVDGQNVIGFSNNNSSLLIREIFQTPRREGPITIDGDYYFEENSGQTKVFFTGNKSENSYDISGTDVPLGGIISSVGSTTGNGYQPLVSAGGTAIVGVDGSIQSINIQNLGSGYRSGIQTVNVGVTTFALGTPSIDYIGIASVLNGSVVSVLITNPGTGYTSSNPPTVVFDAPIGYYNIPLKYSSISQSGIGTGAFIDLIVSQSGKISEFNIKNNGYGYKVGDILTVDIGGSVGIPTDLTKIFNEFQIYVDKVYNDTFSSWTFGELEVLDSFDKYFDGKRKTFSLYKDGIIKSIRSKKGSNIDIQATLLVFINNILQVPGQGYIFDGGSTITFTEAPKGATLDDPNGGDKSKILFYRGTPNVDVLDVDILETIEPGDKVQINSDNIYLKENERVVSEIISSDSLLTNPYTGEGISEDSQLLRPLKWCKSKEDKVIDGKFVTKDRISYQSIVNPVTNIIQSVGIGTTAEIFVENIKTFFDSEKEFATGKILSTIELISQDENNPEYEVIKNVSYEGDFGFVTGITTTTVGLGLTAIVFDLSIPSDSYLEDISITNPTISESGIKTGYYFAISNSNVGSGVTSLRSNGSIVSIGSSYLDNVYQVFSAQFLPETITSSTIIFTTKIYNSPTIINDSISVTIEDQGTIIVDEYLPLKVTVLVSGYGNLQDDIDNSEQSYFGNFSWGRITSSRRSNPKQFTHFNNGLLGISTSPIVRRLYPLKNLNYLP